MSRYTPEQVAQQQETYDQCVRLFKGRCAWHLSHPANAIHEIEPRSYRPSDWWELDNRIPLCREIHERIHQEGWRNWVDKLHAQRRRALRLISPDWVDEMENRDEPDTEDYIESQD